MTPQEARNEYRRQYRKNMTPAQRQREREYNRKWRQDHPELVKAAQERFWARKAAEIRNPDQITDTVQPVGCDK